jgi:hypothetical protein
MTHLQQARIQAQNLITMCKEACIKTQKYCKASHHNHPTWGLYFKH